MAQIRYLLFLLLISTYTSSLLAYTDSDMDGVDDKDDRCPNTPFMELVDIDGCTTKYLISPHHFDIILGASYSDSDYLTLNKTDTLSSSLQLDYYYKNFSMQLSTSYFSTSGDGYDEDGLYDTFVGVAYQFYPVQNLTLRVGLGSLLPTYDAAYNNNNPDYTSSLNLSYNLKKLNLFAGYTYTMINDDDVHLIDDTNTTIDIVYQDTNGFNAGAGYYISDKLYLSASYNFSDSIYKGIEDIKTASLYGYYSFDENYFATFSYAYGLSDSASKDYLSFKIGYYY